MLHEWHIDQRQYARHENRRGRRHAYSSIDAHRTALVVIHMVPFFVEANPYAAGIVPNVNRLAHGLRAAERLLPGDGDLAQQLARRNIDTVLVVGAVANVCCESTVRDASTLGYRTIMVADANAAVSDADLNATLNTVYRSFVDVRSTTAVLDLIGADL